MAIPYNWQKKKKKSKTIWDCCGYLCTFWKMIDAVVGQTTSFIFASLISLKTITCPSTHPVCHHAPSIDRIRIHFIKFIIIFRLNSCFLSKLTCSTFIISFIQTKSILLSKASPDHTKALENSKYWHTPFSILVVCTNKWKSRFLWLNAAKNTNHIEKCFK